MADVRIQRPLSVPPVPAFGTLQEVLDGIASQKGSWCDFTLHVSLGDLHLPDVGYVAVPIALSAGHPMDGRHALELTFTSSKNPTSFPTFRGTAGIDSTGPSGSILWLGGAYDVPMSLFGRLFDATVAAGVAARTLENLADDLAAAVVAIVEKREEEYLRYSLYRR